MTEAIIRALIAALAADGKEVVKIELSMPRV